MSETQQQWRLIDGNGTEVGPVSAEDLQRYAADGTIAPHTQVWTEGLDGWIPASQVEGLFPSEPRRPQLVTGAPAPGAPVQAYQPGSPVQSRPPIHVSQPRSSGATTLIVLAVVIPLVAGGLYLAFRAKPNSVPDQTPVAESTEDPEPATPVDRPEADEAPETAKTTEPAGLPAETRPLTTRKPATPKPATGDITDAQWEAIEAIQELGGRFMDKALLEVEVPFGRTEKEVAVTDAHLALLSRLRSLKTVRLNCSQISNEGLKHLRSLDNLRVLEIDAPDFSDTGLAALAKLRGLMSLSLSSAKITDAGLAHLEALGSLEDLTLVSEGITDSGLVHLEALRSLRVLILFSNQVTNAGLVHLEKLKGARRIHLQGFKIRESGLSRLRKALPSCEVKEGFPTVVSYSVPPMWKELTRDEPPSRNEDRRGVGPFLDTPFAGRFPRSEQKRRLERAGFPETAPDAVAKALDYLATTQGKIGSWGERERIAATSLALLAYLGNGETVLSQAHGEEITYGIIFLVDRCKKQNGRLGSPLDHALGTMALAESYLSCRKLEVNLPHLEEQLTEAVTWIVENTHEEGGWARAFAKKGEFVAPESQLTIPLVHALWLAREAGIQNPDTDAVIANALRMIARAQNARGKTPRQGDSLAGGFALASFLAKKGGHPTAREALRTVAEAALPTDERLATTSGLLSLHYDMLAVAAFDSPNQEKWFAPRIEAILKLQNDDGSFQSPIDQPGDQARDEVIIRTALACLLLETPWRYDYGGGE